MRLFHACSAVVTGIVLVVGVAARAAAPDPSAVANRLGNVKRLIEVSSGAKQVEASGNPEALALRERARELHGQAQERFHAGDMVQANELLNEASRTMFEAVRAAGAPESAQAKRKRDFESFETSIQALREALSRVAAEKNQPEKSQQVSDAVEPLLREARELATQGNYDEGQKRLDAAYQIVKAAIAELRGGETLTKPVQFASKAEEFQYELNRNETLAMLYQLLAGPKVTAETMQRTLNDVNAARTAALGLAKDGDYEGAIATLDRSTRILGRELNRSGVYVPM